MASHSRTEYSSHSTLTESKISTEKTVTRFCCSKYHKTVSD